MNAIMKNKKTVRTTISSYASVARAAWPRPSVLRVGSCLVARVLALHPGATRAGREPPGVDETEAKTEATHVGGQR